jgi:hypothetical protein
MYKRAIRLAGVGHADSWDLVEAVGITEPKAETMRDYGKLSKHRQPSDGVGVTEC